MPKWIAAAATHVLTASGIVWAWLALNAAFDQRWEAMFAWLGVALFVDAIDGPIARWVKVDELLPRFSGERLDLIIDYVSYVLVPAVALAKSGLLPESASGPAAAAILLSSLYHFADRESKTADNFFVGFPALWNVVALYLFAIQPPPAIALGVVAVCVIATFVPFVWVHPLRVVAWRKLTLGVTALASIAAIVAVVTGFPAPAYVQFILIAALVYMLLVTVAARGSHKGRASVDRD